MPGGDHAHPGGQAPGGGGLGRDHSDLAPRRQWSGQAGGVDPGLGEQRVVPTLAMHVEEHGTAGQRPPHRRRHAEVAVHQILEAEKGGGAGVQLRLVAAQPDQLEQGEERVGGMPGHCVEGVTPRLPFGSDAGGAGVRGHLGVGERRPGGVDRRHRLALR